MLQCSYTILFILECRRCRIIQNCSRKQVLITINTLTDLARYFCYAMWLSSSATLDLKLSLNMSQCEKLSQKFISQHELSQISKAQKLGPRPTALAFPKRRPGQKPSQAKVLARLGPAFFGPAWLGFWPQAGAGTSLAKDPVWS